MGRQDGEGDDQDQVANEDCPRCAGRGQPHRRPIGVVVDQRHQQRPARQPTEGERHRVAARHEGEDTDGEQRRSCGEGARPPVGAQIADGKCGGDRGEEAGEEHEQQAQDVCVDRACDRQRPDHQPGGDRHPGPVGGDRDRSGGRRQRGHDSRRQRDEGGRERPVDHVIGHFCDAERVFSHHSPNDLA